MQRALAACLPFVLAALAGVLACGAAVAAEPNDDRDLQRYRARQEQFRVRALQALNDGQAALLQGEKHEAAVCYARALVLYPVSPETEQRRREQSHPFVLFQSYGIDLEERDQKYLKVVNELDAVYRRQRSAAENAHRKSRELEELGSFAESLAWELEARKGVGYFQGGWCGTCDFFHLQRLESRLILLQFKGGRPADAVAGARKFFFSEQWAAYGYSPDVVSRFVDEESRRLKLTAIEAECDQFAEKRLRERADFAETVAAQGHTAATLAVKAYIALRRTAVAGDKAALWALVTANGVMPSAAHETALGWVQHRAAVELEKLPGVPQFVEQQSPRSALDRAWALLVLARLTPQAALAKIDAVLQAPDTGAESAKECFYALLCIGGQEVANVLRRYRIPGHPWTRHLAEAEQIWNNANADAR